MLLYLFSSQSQSLSHPRSRKTRTFAKAAGEKLWLTLMGVTTREKTHRSIGWCMVSLFLSAANPHPIPNDTVPTLSRESSHVSSLTRLLGLVSDSLSSLMICKEYTCQSMFDTAATWKNYNVYMNTGVLLGQLVSVTGEVVSLSPYNHRFTPAGDHTKKCFHVFVCGHSCALVILWLLDKTKFLFY
jgi:hypothetical protein